MQGEDISTIPTASGQLIYVVDDEVDIGDLVTMHLNRRGYRARAFSDSVLAHSAFVLGTDKPALLITDYSMRKINGLELLRRCKQLQPGLKTLCVSGSLTDDVFAAAEVKPDAMLQKPFSRDELVAKVEALIGRAVAEPGDG